MLEHRFSLKVSKIFSRCMSSSREVMLHLNFLNKKISEIIQVKSSNFLPKFENWLKYGQKMFSWNKNQGNSLSKLKCIALSKSELIVQIPWKPRFFGLIGMYIQVIFQENYSTIKLMKQNYQVNVPFFPFCRIPKLTQIWPKDRFLD